MSRREAWLGAAVFAATFVVVVTYCRVADRAVPDAAVDAEDTVVARVWRGPEPPPLEAGMARFGYDKVGDDGWQAGAPGFRGTRFPFPVGSPTLSFRSSNATATGFPAWPSATTFVTESPSKLFSMFVTYDVDTGEAQKVSAYLAHQGAGAGAVTVAAGAALYSETGVLLAQSESATFAPASATGWYEFDLLSHPDLTGQKPILAFWSQVTPEAVVRIAYDAIGEYSPPDDGVWDPPGATGTPYSPTMHVWVEEETPCAGTIWARYHCTATVAGDTPPPDDPDHWERVAGGGGYIMGEATPGAFLGQVRMGRESATQYGASTTVTSYLWPCMSAISINANDNVVETNCKVGDRGVADVHSTRHTVDGRIRVEVGPENVHKLLYWAHGGYALAATIAGTGAATAYEHNVANGGAETPYSFSTWLDIGETERAGSTVMTLIPGMYITGYDMTIGDRSLLTLDLDYMGQQQRLVSPTTPFSPALSALQPFVAKEHLKHVRLGARELACEFVNGSIRYDGTLTARENAGDRYIQGAYAGRGRAEIQFVLDFDNLASVVDYMGQSPTTSPTLPVAMVWPKREEVLRLTWESDEVASSAAGEQMYSMEAYAPRYQFTAMVRELPEDSDAPLRVEFRGQALESLAATTVALRGDIIWRFWNRLPSTAFTA